MASPNTWDPDREPLLSLAMIVRDEASDLPRCLDSARGMVDEMVVVDTGSADATRDVAAAAGALVHDVPWRDDFAAARNASLDLCRGRWVLVLDADEVLAPSSAGLLRAWVEAHDGGRCASCVRSRPSPPPRGCGGGSGWRGRAGRGAGAALRGLGRGAGRCA